MNLIALLQSCQLSRRNAIGLCLSDLLFQDARNIVCTYADELWELRATYDRDWPGQHHVQARQVIWNHAHQCVCSVGTWGIMLYHQPSFDSRLVLLRDSNTLIRWPSLEDFDNYLLPVITADADRVYVATATKPLCLRIFHTRPPNSRLKGVENGSPPWKQYDYPNSSFCPSSLLVWTPPSSGKSFLLALSTTGDIYVTDAELPSSFERVWSVAAPRRNEWCGSNQMQLDRASQSLVVYDSEYGAFTVFSLSLSSTNGSGVILLLQRRWSFDLGQRYVDLRLFCIDPHGLLWLKTRDIACDIIEAYSLRGQQVGTLQLDYSPDEVRADYLSSIAFHSSQPVLDGVSEKERRAHRFVIHIVPNQPLLQA
jgi:hypothetical protein